MNGMMAAGGAATPDLIARQSKLLPHLLRRCVGAWTDLFALGLILVVPDYLLGNDQYRATMAIWIGAAILYFPLCEGIWGRTVGKLITGLVVVDKDGHAPGILKAVVRTVLRLAEVNPLLLGGVPAGIA